MALSPWQVSEYRFCIGGSENDPSTAGWCWRYQWTTSYTSGRVHIQGVSSEARTMMNVPIIKGVISFVPDGVGWKLPTLVGMVNISRNGVGLGGAFDFES